MTTLYVHENGNDSDTGLSESSPLKSLGEAYSRLEDNKAARILLMRGDEFIEDAITWEKSGASESDRIEVDSYGDGDDAKPLIIFRDNHNSDKNGIHQPTGRRLLSNISFRNLSFAFLHHTLENVAKVATIFEAQTEQEYNSRYSEYIRFYHCHFNKDAIWLRASNLEISHCDALHCGFKVMGIHNLAPDYGRWTYGRNIVFTDNTVRKCFGSHDQNNICAFSAWYIDGLVIARNTFEDNGFGMTIDNERISRPHETNGDIHIHQCLNVTNESEPNLLVAYD